LGFAFASWYLVVARPSSSLALGLCVALVVLGCLVRSWSAGYLLKGKRTAVGGPYAYIRNPLYIGSFVIGIGFCAALWRWPPTITSVGLAAAFLVGFGTVYRAKTLAEEKELAAHLGAPYQAYARTVPAFLPVRGRVRGLGAQRFSWELYRRNREYECILGSASLLAYLYWRYRYGS
jgi:protein-S-isoprenylcysteine O-methyltransferase Ste14